MLYNGKEGGIFLIFTTRMIPLFTSTSTISKQERATGFGRWGERVANVPFFCDVGNLGGDTLGPNFSLV